MPLDDRRFVSHPQGDYCVCNGGFYVNAPTCHYALGFDGRTQASQSMNSENLDKKNVEI